MNEKPNILVVEDEGIVALDICQSLECLGYNVLAHVDTGEDAVTWATQHKPDLVLMDINLKGEMDGIQAAAKIHSSSGSPVVFLTAHADEATLQRAKLTQPFGYLLKPFENDDLRATIEIVLYRTRPSNSSAGDKIPEEDSDSLDLTAKSSDGQEDWTHALQSLELFSGLPVSELTKLSQSFTIRSVEGGKVVTDAETKPAGGFIVLSGRLAVTKSAASGKELTVELLPPGDGLGLVQALEFESPECTIRAQIPTKLLWIPTSVLQDFSRRHPIIYQQIARLTSERLRKSHDLAISLAHSKVETRIVSTLIALAPRIGKKGGDQMGARIFITRKELADLTGTTTETAIRVTKNLERNALLDLARPGIIKILDIRLLESLLADS